jgi:MSHA biogenesis protein MshO
MPPGLAGFTLVELVVVIVVSGIIASVIGMFIAGPIQGFFDQARRAGLVDAAQLALTRMGRDLRASLPNSVRISGSALELLATLDGDRYRTELPGDASQILAIGASDAQFNTFSPLYPPSPLVTPYSVTGSLAIYPLRQGGADPYSDAVMTAPGTMTVDSSPVGGNAEYRITLAAAHTFPFDSPTHRVFLVSGPVTYLCSGGQLLRYDGYALQATQVDTEAGLDTLLPVKTVVAKNVESCAFSYDPGTATRNAVVSASVGLLAGGERVRLMRQVQVDNTP